MTMCNVEKNKDDDDAKDEDGASEDDGNVKVDDEL